MIARLLRSIAWALGVAAATMLASCNLLVGDYTIWDGSPAAVGDAAPEDAAGSDLLQTDRPHPDRSVPGKQGNGGPDGGPVDATTP